MADSHEPIRTCIGCRSRAPQGQLVRYVLAHGPLGEPRVVQDGGRQLPGRGAWLHDVEDCRQLAIRRRALRRALRIAGDVEVGLSDPAGAATGNDGVGHVTSPPEHRGSGSRR